MQDFFDSTFLRVFEKSANSLVIKADPPRFTMLAVSDQYLALSSTQREDLIGNGVFDVFPDNQSAPNGALSAQKAFMDVIRTKQTVSLPVYRYDIFSPETGKLETFYWSNTNVPILDDDGEVAYILNTTTDITQQVLLKQKEELARLELDFQQQRLNQLVEQAPIAISLLRGRQLVVESANKPMLELWGKPASIISLPIVEALPEIVKQGFVELLLTVYESGEPYYGNEILVSLNRNGQLVDVYFNFVYAPIREIDGSISGVMVVATEVTNQIKARQDLQESEMRFRNLIKEAPVAISLFVGREMVVEFPNEAIVTIWGKGNNVEGKPLREALPELEGQPFLQILDDVYTTGVAYQAQEERCDLVVDGKLGTYYFDFTYKPLHNADGEVYAIVDIAIDVTQQVLARQQLEASEKRFRILLEAISQMTWTNTPQGEVNFYNQRWYDYTGLNFEQTQAWGWQAVVHPDDLPGTMEAYINALTSGTIFVIENRYKRGSDGMYRWHLNRALPVRDETGAITLWVGTATDIHEQKHLATELEQQVKARTHQLQQLNFDLRRSNENLQQFAYIASHDLQEPLRKIQSFGDLLKRQHAAELGEGLDHLERMQSAAHRMSILIKDLLTFSRISTRQENASSVSLNQVIATVLDNLEVVVQETNAHVQVGELPTISGDESQLQQLFQNLLSNALKFHRPAVMPVIRIDYQLLHAIDLPETVKPGRQAAAYHRINVSDNGIGFDEKYVDRIFQVFQRLHGKSQYEGTGIGLAICEKVAANHGGAITAISRPGEGAIFQLYLPA